MRFEWTDDCWRLSGQPAEEKQNWTESVLRRYLESLIEGVLKTMELAMLLVSSFSAILQSLQTWNDLRGRGDVQVQTRVLTKAEIVEQATAIRTVLSDETIKKMLDRVQACERRFNEVLDSVDYSPSEKDQAAVAVGACMCREMWRIKLAGNDIPGGDGRRFGTRLIARTESQKSTHELHGC
jgi:hypothetical protein